MLIDDLRAAIPQATPRPAKLLPGLALGAILRSRALLFPLAMIVFAGLFPVLIFASDPAARLAARGSTTSGRVESIARGDVCRGREGVTVHYAFSAGTGTVYRGSQDLCADSAYAGVARGDSLPISFLAHEPEVNRIAERDPNTPPAAIFVVFPLMASLFVLPFLVPRIRQLVRDRRLFRTGRLLAGRVVYVVQRTDAGWPGVPVPTRAEVFVRLAEDGGPAREVKTICTNDWLLLHLAPGTEVTVCAVGGDGVLLENYYR